MRGWLTAFMAATFGAGALARLAGRLEPGSTQAAVAKGGALALGGLGLGFCVMALREAARRRRSRRRREDGRAG